MTQKLHSKYLSAYEGLHLPASPLICWISTSTSILLWTITLGEVITEYFRRRECPVRLRCSGLICAFRRRPREPNPQKLVSMVLSFSCHAITPLTSQTLRKHVTSHMILRCAGCRPLQDEGIVSESYRVEPTHLWLSHLLLREGLWMLA